MDKQDIKKLPKLMLHDHLDGGVRVSTLIELAKEIGYEKLPTYEPSALQEYILTNSKRGKLELYLETFDHTIAVMQTPEALERVAYECGEDMKKDGVIYIESRFAPQLFTAGTEDGKSKMGLEEVMEAIQTGFSRAEKDFNILIKILCCSMKQFEPTVEVAELALKYHNESNPMVVGFDLAGPEEGFLCSKHLEAIETAKRGGLSITLHAGEGAGLDSIADAIKSQAQRLGHGVRIADDIKTNENSNPEDKYLLGDLAQTIKSSKIPLEVCPTSNLHTGISESFETHPIFMLVKAGFEVTLNTDNRLMSDITLSQEFINCQEAFGWDEEGFHQLTLNALNAAFCSDKEKQDLLATINTK